jgi:glucose/arabinose dehydrogenase/N-acetylneuraminic acid mutarotase
MTARLAPIRFAVRAAILASLCAVALCALPGGAVAQTGSFELRLSSSPDRSASVPLQGAQANGDIYVFVSPATGISQVRFWIDDPQRVGPPHRTEGAGPWDMNGTADDGTALPFNSAVLGDGTHTVTAVVTQPDGATQTLQSTFTVNQQPQLWLSGSPDRSNPVLLDGRTVSGNIYVFTSNSAGISAVRFFVDDPGMTGSPRRVDLLAPWDLGGEGSLGVAPPFDTRTLSNGVHRITAAIDRMDGTTTVVTAQMTVNNPQLADYRLVVSSQADRAAPVPLSGDTVDGNAYVFTTPDADVQRVDFWVDDPTRSGPVYHGEGAGPFDLVGTAANGQALPFDTRTLANGPHTVTAAIRLISGVVHVVSASFTVENVQASPCAPISCSQVRVSYPYELGFGASHGMLPDSAGVGTGFTWVAQPSGHNGYKPQNLAMDLATGRLRITTTNGLAHAASNNQDNTLGVGLPTATVDEGTELQTTLVNPPSGTGQYQQAGLWIGKDQDNFAKLVLVSQPGGNRIQFLREANGAVAGEALSGVVTAAGTNVALRIEADPVAGTLKAFYKVGAAAEQALTTLTAPPQFFSRGGAPVDPQIGTATFGGIFASHRNGPSPVTYAFDGFSAALDPGPPPPPPPPECSPLACDDALVSYPYALHFGADHGGIKDSQQVGTGFTWVDHPATGSGYKPQNLTTDLATGRLRITTTSGLAHAASNNQDNTLGVGLPTGSGNAVTALETTIVNPPAGTGQYQQAGLWIGKDQDNFAKLALVSTPSGSQIQLLREAGGTVVGEAGSGTVAVNGSRVLLELRADPVNGTLAASYRIGSGGSRSLGTLPAPPEFFSRGAAQIDSRIGTATFGGIFASHRNGPSPLTYAFDGFSAAEAGPPPPPPPKCFPLACGEILVDLPYELDFEGDHGKVQDGDGGGTGFTTLLRPAGDSGYLPDQLDVDPSTGRLRVETTAGVFHQGENSQDNALGVGVDAPSQISVVQATIASPPAGTGSYEQAGIWFGTDQDNYNKLVVMSTPAGMQVEHLMEVGAGVTADDSATIPAGSNVTLTLAANPSTRQISASYRVGAGGPQQVGTFSAPPEFFSFDAAGIDPEIGTRSFAGIMATHRRGQDPLTYAFEHFSVTAEEAPPPPPNEDGIEFDRATFPVPFPTSIAYGPGNKLYVLEMFGTIHEFTLGADGMPISEQVINTLGTRLALGLTVDPDSTAGQTSLWVSHSSPSLDNGVPNSGAITKLSGPGFTQRQDVITGLPRAKANHATNSIHFGPDGKLYLAQGGNTGAGAPNDSGTEFGDMQEQPLSAALLVADVKNPSFDGSCANPTDIFGPPPCHVQVFASGLRNTYDFVFHSNGLIYGANNGLGVAGTFPPSPTAPCLGFAVDAPWDDGGHNPGSQPDVLNILEQGRYYGHPNPYRNECVFGDGHFQNVAPHPTFTPPVHNLGDNRSANGTVEYASNAFCGALKGDLLIANYSVGDDLTRVELSGDGRSVEASSSLVGSFNDPLPVAQSPGGRLYVGELGAGRVTVLHPRDLGCWSTLAPHPAQILDAGGAGLGGKLYVVAGKTATAYRSAVEIYDPATDSWSSAAPLPGPAVENPAVVPHNGKLYAFGGSTDAFSGAVQNSAVFDPATGQWTPRAPMPTARGGAAAQVIGGKIYVVGGMNANGASVETVEIYDPVTNTWTAGPSMSTRRDNPGAAAVDGLLYVFGGRTRNADGTTVNGTLTSVEMLDTATGQWTPRAPMPTGRRTMVVGRLNGRVQLMGGEVRADGGSFFQNEEYNPATDTWRTLKPMLTGRHGAAGGTVDGVVYAVGGGSTGGSSFTSLNEAFSLP